MKNISSKELRSIRSAFRLSKDHVYLPESSLVGGKESTAMFTIAGMQQLIPYLSGKEHPLGKKLFNIQKCIRTVDIDEVGDASHLTCFEMMGNWSLGSYFKQEAVQRSREFLVDILGFDPNKLAVTVFEGDADAPKDDETAGYWTQVGMSEERIAYMSAANNRRSPGPVGPCGPDTEIFYRVGTSEFPPQGSTPKTDDDNRLEIWNNVFMEFYRGEDGKLTKLKNQNVDTGMGFERMAKVLQEKKTVFDTDIFVPLLTLIEKTLGISYVGNEKRCRIIADHIRTSFFLLLNNILPSNEGRGYVLRRLIRRMCYSVLLLQPLTEKAFDEFIVTIVSLVDALMDTHADVQHISSLLKKEVLQFQKTIAYGQKLLDELILGAKNHSISGKDIFKLYDTFGFPLELTKEILEEKYFVVDVDGFQKEMELQQERSRAGSKDMFKQGIDRANYLQGVPPTQFVGYDALASTTVTLLKDFTLQGQRILVFDITPFYAESGGQVGDSGTILLSDTSEVIISHVQKYNGVFLHFVAM